MIAIVLYVIIPIICLIGAKKRKSIDDFLDKDATLAMRGVGMLFIVYTHKAAENICPDTYFYYVSGVIGVGICFLVSGYGLHISYKKKNDYLKGFWLPKVLRLLLPFLIAFIIFWLLKMAQGNECQALEVFKSLITFRIPGTTLWYLKIQMLMYVTFYFAYRFAIKPWKKILGVFFVAIIYMIIAALCGLEQFWFNTCLFFPIGLLLAEYQEKLLPIIRKKLPFIISIIIFASIYGMLYFFGRMNMALLIDTVYMLCFCMILLWIGQYFTRFRVLEIIGKYSIEVYLLHIVLGGSWFDATNPFAYILIPLICVLIGMPIHWLSEKITKALCKQKKTGDINAIR